MEVFVIMEDDVFVLDESEFLNFMLKIEEEAIKKAEKELENEKQAIKQCKK